VDGQTAAIESNEVRERPTGIDADARQHSDGL
jgi:hypothetical protein